MFALGGDGDRFVATTNECEYAAIDFDDAWLPFSLPGDASFCIRDCACISAPDRAIDATSHLSVVVRQGVL